MAEWSAGGCQLVGRCLQIEQVTLPGLRETFSTSAKYPTLVQSEFVQRGGMLLLQFLVRGRSLIQHTVKFRYLLLRLGGASFSRRSLLLQLGGLLKGSDQEAVTFGHIVG